MTTTHTPGHWKVEGLVPLGHAQFWTVTGRGMVTGYGVSEAGARLIAAAPELLEALKALVTTHPQRAPRPGMSEPDELVNARAAIAKAEGR